MEVWKTIPNYPKYEVSSYGRIRNKEGKVLSQFCNQDNEYPCVGLTDGSHYVHRFVADLFCERLEGQSQVNHKDFDRTHNFSSNLEWCTPSENSKHYVAAGRGVQKPYNLIDPDGNVHVGTNLQALCEEYNLQQGNLHKVNKGQRKMHKGWTQGGAYV